MTMCRHPMEKAGVVSVGLCAIAVSAFGQHEIGDYLTPGIVEQVERQLEPTRDEDGKPLPGWYPQPWRPRIRISVSEPFNDRVQMNRNLDEIRVPRMSFRESPIREVVKSFNAAMTGSPRLERNVNVRLKLSPNYKGPRKLTLEIEETTARRALRQVVDKMGAKLIVEPFGVSIVAE